MLSSGCITFAKHGTQRRAGAADLLTVTQSMGTPPQPHAQQVQAPPWSLGLHLWGGSPRQ
ncbi:hypothetical protein GCM10010207_54830 [Streptomyces atratus]|nr:hypothetical protein GCM10010207_54830 [Streptomyces atratus]